LRNKAAKYDPMGWCSG